MTRVTSDRVTDVTRGSVTPDTCIACRAAGPSECEVPVGTRVRTGEVTIVAEKKISPKAPAAKAKKESGKTEAATRVSRVKRVQRVQRVKRVKRVKR